MLMAYGKIISVSDDGADTVSQLLDCDQPEAVVTSSLMAELMKLSVLLDCTQSVKDTTNSASPRRKNNDYSSGAFVTGLIVGGGMDFGS